VLEAVFVLLESASLNIEHFHKLPFYPPQVEQLAYSTQKHLFKRVVPRIRVKSLGMALKGVFPSN
jgi:hypothetical protein